MSAPRRPALAPFRASLAIARKELLESFRDRQTTLYAVILPIALYPFLFWLMIQGWLFVQGRQEHTEVRVGIAAASGARVPDGISSALETRPVDDDLAPERRAAQRELHRVHVEVAPRPLDEDAARAWTAHADPVGEDAPKEAGPDAVLYLRSGGSDGDTIRTGDEDARFYFDSTESRSELARKRVESRLPRYVERLRADRATELARDPAELQPFQLEEDGDLAEEQERGAYQLSVLLPMLLVVMTVMGAFYPAVDLTAGERERNTAETTLLLPVPRLAVHRGKILAVCAAALLATSLNLLALGLSAGHLVNMLRAGADVKIELPLQAFAAIAPLALLFAFFVSAVLTGVAALARTFKEGQALLGPVQMLFLFPAMAGAIPGLALTPGLALVPVVNVVLAFRALLKGESMPLEYALTALSLFVFAWIAMRLAVRVLSREALVASTRSFRLDEFVRLLRADGGSR